ncbi:MAG: hypothetical protein KJ077_20145 [Anaerolineae bacterium]|nr:hypothetical protein [Anaerolineae bacterium]
MHTIFRNPRRIHHLISRTVREAMGIARTATAHSAQLLEQGGIQILRQVTRTPGKFRVVVLKQFDRAIGVNGETVLKIVIDMSGRVVTAYPVERLLALGVTAVSVNIFDENTARASERIRSRAREEFAEEEERPIDWIGELIDLLNPLSIDYLNQAHCAAWE